MYMCVKNSTYRQKCVCWGRVQECNLTTAIVLALERVITHTLTHCTDEPLLTTAILGAGGTTMKGLRVSISCSCGLLRAM